MYDVKGADTHAKVKNFHNTVDGQHARAWSYECLDHPIDLCFTPGFWAVLRSNLMAGDTIVMTRMMKGCCVASCIGMVVEVTDEDVDFRMHSDHIVYYSERDDFKKEVIKIKEEPPPAYIKGDGKIKWNPGKGCFDIRVEGVVVAEAADKDTAERIVRGDMPMPVLEIRTPKKKPEKSFREPDDDRIGPTIENAEQLKHVQV